MALVSMLGTEYFAEKCSFAHEANVIPIRPPERGRNSVTPPVVRVHDEELRERYFPDVSVVTKICHCLL